MPLHEARTRLEHMRDAARKCLQFTRGKSQAQVEGDEILSLALIRLLEIMGEAAARIPAEQRGALPTIRWKGVIGLRHRLIHGYASVDFDIVWDILQNDVPCFCNRLTKFWPAWRGNCPGNSTAAAS
jgi:uncharacterized protein with HEPN domain